VARVALSAARESFGSRTVLDGLDLQPERLQLLLLLPSGPTWFERVSERDAAARTPS